MRSLAAKAKEMQRSNRRSLCSTRKVYVNRRAEGGGTGRAAKLAPITTQRAIYPSESWLLFSEAGTTASLRSTPSTPDDGSRSVGRVQGPTIDLLARDLCSRD